MEPFQLDVPAKDQPISLHLQRWMNDYPNLSVGMTTRNGGNSEGDFFSLNCALHVHDNEHHVIENRQRVARSVGFDFEAWTCGEQVHDHHVAKVTSKDRGKGKLSRESAFQNTDAMMTNEPDILLTSFYADCVPLYFYDPEHKAIAIAHAGWRGTALQIAIKTIEAMGVEYGTRPGQLRVAIGPSIGSCCYEVDRSVIDSLRNSAFDIGLDLIVPAEHRTGHVMIDLKDVNRQFMIKAGIMPTYIEISGWCTSCHTDILYSHRKENGKTGRMTSWIGLRKEV